MANDKFEDYCATLGIPAANIPNSLPRTVIDFILADMYMQIAMDNVGSEGNLIGEANLYQTIYALYSDQYAKLKPRITANLILGDAVDLNTSATSWGKLYRG
jgi:hypothetical protein